MSSPPVKYTRKGNFTANQQGNPQLPPSATLLDQEFNAVKATTDQTISRLAEIQRPDGELANLSVGRDQLSAEIVMGVDTPTDWAPFTLYTVRNSVIVNNAWYWCEVEHTSGAVWDAAEQTYWQIIANWQAAADAADASAAQAAASAAAAHTSEVNAAASAASVGNSVSQAAASATAAANSATASANSATQSANSATASATSAGNAHTSEVNAAASAQDAADSAAEAIGGASDADNITSGTLSAQFIDYDTTRLTAVGTKLKALGPTTNFNAPTTVVATAIDGALNYNNSGANSTWTLPPVTPGAILGIQLPSPTLSCTIVPAGSDHINTPNGQSYVNGTPLVIPAGGTYATSLATIFLVGRAGIWDVLSVSPSIADVMGWVSRPYFIGIWGGGSFNPANGTWTKVNMGPVFDSHGWWDSANTRYTPKRPGKYRGSFSYVGGDASTGAVTVMAAIYKNGGGGAYTIFSWNGTALLPNQSALIVERIFDMTGATDFLEPYLYIQSAAPSVSGATGGEPKFEITYLGP